MMPTDVPAGGEQNLNLQPNEPLIRVISRCGRWQRPLGEMSLPGYTICCVRARCWISRPVGLQERVRGEGSEKVAPVTYGRTASASCCGLMHRGGDWALQAQVRLLAENSQQEAE